MPSLHKTLILAYIRKAIKTEPKDADIQGYFSSEQQEEFTVQELAIGTEHAPFRHKKQAFILEPGEQQKKKRKLEVKANAAVESEKGAEESDKSCSSPYAADDESASQEAG
jgi:hypothetical protein